MNEEKENGTEQGAAFNEIETYFRVIERLLEAVESENIEHSIAAAKELRWWLEVTTGIGITSAPHEQKTIHINKKSDVPLWILALISFLAVAISILVLVI